MTGWHWRVHTRPANASRQGLYEKRRALWPAFFVSREVEPT